MPFYFVDPEVYKKYRDQVIEMAQSIQINYPEHMPAEKRKPGFSDEEIAEKLGIEARTVSEIRCVAKREFYGVDEWEKAVEFKDRQCRSYADQGLSFTTKKYFEAKKAKG